MYKSQGDTCPSFAEDYHRATANCSSMAPKVLIDDEDEAAIYYLSLIHISLPPLSLRDISP